eukprot:tig00000523_g1826.t1
MADTPDADGPEQPAKRIKTEPGLRAIPEVLILRVFNGFFKRGSPPDFVEHVRLALSSDGPPTGPTAAELAHELESLYGRPWGFEDSVSVDAELRLREALILRDRAEAVHAVASAIRQRAEWVERFPRRTPLLSVPASVAAPEGPAAAPAGAPPASAPPVLRMPEISHAEWEGLRFEKYYAVSAGRVPGVYEAWKSFVFRGRAIPGAADQVVGVSGSSCKSAKTVAACLDILRQAGLSVPDGEAA